jgi:hypothetical protein
MRFLIVTGMPRSGSTFLANLLAEAPGAAAAHEHFADRHFTALSFYRPDHPALAARLAGERAALEQSMPGAERFIDVNPWLRHGLDAVAAALGDPPVVHLVRDGRKVVQSWWITKAYTRREKTVPFLPEDPAALAAWEGWNRFERICWLWQETVRRLMTSGMPLLILEKAVTDYAHLHERLLGPHGIPLEEEQWDRFRNRRFNRSRFKLKDLIRGRPVRMAWGPEEERRFDAICGEAMAALGYR